jgi:hypothetical protein
VAQFGDCLAFIADQRLDEQQLAKQAVIFSAGLDGPKITAML